MVAMASDVTPSTAQPSTPTAAAPPLAPLLTALLGALWLIDGILQLQPKMFGQDFVNGVLAPLKAGEPSFMVHVVNFGIRAWNVNTDVANAASAAIQLAIGLLLLLPVAPRWRRAALWGSVAWAAGVWVFGEAAGGLLTGSASFYTGAPGSVLLYGILALALLYPDRIPLARLPQLAAAVFLFGAALNALPYFWRDGNSAAAMYSFAQGDPNGWVAWPANQLARIPTSGVGDNLVAIGLLLLFGVLLLVRPSRLLGWLTIAFLVLVWWISQDFGGILTFPNGTATDPNTAVLLMILVLPAALSVPYPRWAARFAFAPSFHTGAPVLVSRVAEVPVEADDRRINW
jgi:hypothetical protein